MPDTAQSPSSANGEAPNFETALSQLQTIVHELEEGQIGLEASLTRFEEGVRLLRNCYQILEEVEQRIEILTGTDAEGNPLLASFDATATIHSAEQGTKKPGRRRTTTKPAAAPPVDATPPAAEPEEPRLF